MKSSRMHCIQSFTVYSVQSYTVHTHTHTHTQIYTHAYKRSRAQLAVYTPIHIHTLIQRLAKAASHLPHTAQLAMSFFFSHSSLPHSILKPSNSKMGLEAKLREIERERERETERQRDRETERQREFEFYNPLLQKY